MKKKQLLSAGVLAVAFATFAEASELDVARDRLGRDARRRAVETMRVAAAEHMIKRDAEFRKYVDIGFNTLVLIDSVGANEAGTSWVLKPEEQIIEEAAFARRNDMWIILAKGTEPHVASGMSKTETYSMAPRASRLGARIGSHGIIPETQDEEIRERLVLWEKHAGDRIIGVYFAYDDVIYQKMPIERQRHLYRLAKQVVPDWYVFGLLGEFGYVATEAEIAAYYAPDAFDHLLLMMYPLNVGYVTGMQLDHVASSDPDGDMIRYVTRYFAKMGPRFIAQLRPGQLAILVGQSFYYTGEPEGHIPRRNDVYLMMVVGNQLIRQHVGQERNRAVGYFYWGSDGNLLVGMWQRPDWLEAARDIHRVLAPPTRRRPTRH